MAMTEWSIDRTVIGQNSIRVVLCDDDTDFLGVFRNEILAAFENVSYLSVVVCFAAFLANDIYGFISWRRMERRQGA